MCDAPPCNASTATALGDNNSDSGFGGLLFPALQLELSIATLLLLALLAQCWRAKRYHRYNIVKKLQLRFFRNKNLTKEARKFFGNLSVREKIFVTDDLPAKQTIIEVSLPDSEIIRPTKILCQYVELSDSFSINSADYFRNKVLSVDLYQKNRNGRFFCRIPIGTKRSYLHIKCLEIFESATNKYWKVDSETHGWVFIKIQHDMLHSDWVLARPGEIDLASDGKNANKPQRSRSRSRRNSLR